MMKRFLTLLTTICLLVSLSSVSFADDTRITTITYHVDPSYVVTIPANVKLNETLEVSATNVVIEYGKTLNVKINGDFKLSNNNHEVAYSITSGSTTINSGDMVLSVDPANSNSGSSTLTFVKPDSGFKYAGDYSGTVNFTISIE